MNDIKNNKGEGGNQTSNSIGTFEAQSTEFKTTPEDTKSMQAAEIKDVSIDISNSEYNEQNAGQKIGTTDSSGVVQSVGHLLRNARLARGMSIEDVSRQLRLSAQQVEAIEREDYEKLPGRTFLRGFIRNYANLVQLEPASLLKLLPHSAPVVSVQHTPFQFKEILLSSNRERNGNNILISIVIFILLLIIAYGIYQSGIWEQESEEINKIESSLSTNTNTDANTNQTTVELALPLPSLTSSDMRQDEQDKQETPSLDDTLTNQSAYEDGSSASSTDSFSPAFSSSLPIENTIGTLHFLFTADSWVKVQDSTGNKIFERINTSGTERVVSGKRPLSLVIGNATGVNLTYNDRPIDLKPYINTNDGVARFTLE